MRTAFKKLMASVLETSFRSPAGLTGWVARSVMRKINPQSIQMGIQRLNLKESDVFLELGAGEGAGVQAMSLQTIPSRVVLVEISEQFQKALQEIKKDLPFRERVEIHCDDCKQMPFLEDNSGRQARTRQ